MATLPPSRWTLAALPLLLAAAIVALSARRAAPIVAAERAVVAGAEAGGRLLDAAARLRGAPVAPAASEGAAARPSDPWAVIGCPPGGVPALVRLLALSAVLAGAGLSWRRGAPWWVSVVGAAAGASIVVGAWRGRPGARRVEAALVGLSVGLVGAVGSALVVVVAGVLLWVPGLVVRLGRAVVGGRGGWRARPVAVAQERRDAAFPFVSTPARVARRRLLAGAAVTVLVVGVFAVARSRPDDASPVAAPIGAAGRPLGAAEAGADADSYYGDLEAGRDEPWADDVYADQLGLVMPDGPVGGFDIADVETETTNVVGGVRRSAPPTTCDTCPEVSVWFTGGSAAFGIGQRDDHTIASDLVARAADEGIRLRVTNLGVPGRTLWQEHQGVLARLATGERPDAVVYYDGFNDVMAASIRSLDEKAPDDEVVTFDDETADAVRRVSGTDVAAGLAALGGPEVLGRHVARRFGDLHLLVGRQLEALGVQALSVLQTDALADPDQAHAAPATVFAPVGDVFDVVERELPPSILSVRQVLDAHPPAFFDVVHTNEAGAALVADAIWPELGPTVRAIAAG